MDKVKNITDIEHIKIIMDQKRQNILQVLRVINTPMTAKQIAEALGLNAATVNFHTNKLCSIGVLKVARTEVIHGIVAKYLEPVAELFKIIANESDKAILSQLKNKVATGAEATFEKARQNYIENCNKKHRILNRLNYTELYMTMEELSRFNEIIDKAITDHSRPASPEQIRFKIFLSCISDDDELGKGKTCC